LLARSVSKDRRSALAGFGGSGTRSALPHHGQRRVLVPAAGRLGIVRRSSFTHRRR
jgi:hypothetical protein